MEVSIGRNEIKIPSCFFHPVLLKRKIETIFSGIFTLQFPEFEVADHDVKRVEEGAKESWYSIPETAFDKITPEESGSRSEQKITQVIDGIDLHSLLQHETCLKARVKIEFLQELADVHVGVMQHVFFEHPGFSLNLEFFVDMLVGELSLAPAEHSELNIRVLASMLQPFPEVMVFSLQSERRILSF